MQEEFLWVEKYRPQCIDDCVLPDRIKQTLNAAVANKEIQHMLFSGGGGCGKSTSAKAIARQLDADVLFIPASEENGIDVLRGKIRSFASSMSLSDSAKIVILDEADYLTPPTQAALRSFMEEFSANCRFILTCNFKNRLIEPLHSRCAVIEFNPTPAELVQLSGKFLKRLKKILDTENVKYNIDALVEIITRFAPDWRRILGECQRAATASNEVNSSAVIALSDSSVTELMKYLKEKDFREMRRWVVENMDLDSTTLFRRIYDCLYDYVAPASIPQAVLIIAEYSYKNAFCADREINLVAAMVELAAQLDFK